MAGRKKRVQNKGCIKSKQSNKMNSSMTSSVDSASFSMQPLSSTLLSNTSSSSETECTPNCSSVEDSNCSLKRINECLIDTQSKKVKLENEAEYWKNGDFVVCEQYNRLWEATVIHVKEEDSKDPIYVIGFNGWSRFHDEEIPHSQSLNRIFKPTEENLQKVKSRENVKKCDAKIIICLAETNKHHQ